MSVILHIDKIKPVPYHRKHSFTEVDLNNGYFIDKYANNGLFQVLSYTLGQTFSWFEISQRKELFKLNGTGHLTMTAEGAEIWYKELHRPIFLFRKREVALKKQLNIESGEYKLDRMNENDRQIYRTWSTFLLEFLRRAIKMDSSVTWRMD